ncbi:MAG: leucyl/phenylalanyl-tRNA--protein transferase [Alphaproteobacteria bacterium]|nr:leucyl/phenylalanyl-tRNA--protein transferase [Alphaproteobacteria bacterium]
MPLAPQVVLRAYAMGVFPMAESRDDEELFWVEPKRRCILPFERVHVARSLARTVRQGRFAVAVDRDFEAVIAACAEPRPGHEQSWINRSIRETYRELHRLGHAHSVECRIGDRLVGGLYGVAIGAAFFGESMFSRATDASKVAFVHLVARLKAGGFVLHDAQFMTDHLRRLGGIEIPRERYLKLLAAAIAKPAEFRAFAGDGDPQRVLQSIAHTS